MLDSSTLLVSSALSKSINPVTLITGIKYETSLLKLINNVTFFYDPNWEYESGNPNYPIAFYFVRKKEEVMESDISTKPMLFYNSTDNTGDATKGSVLNIVADNIVIKPKIYKLDVLVPANESTFENTLIASFANIAYTNAFTFTGKNVENSYIMGSINTVNTVLTAVRTFVKSLYGLESNVSSVLNMLLSQQDYNKASIDYMWSNRRIIKMKMWNGWKFKYVAIKNADISKEGTEGDFYTGSITVQEVPIITFRNQGNSNTSLSKLQSITQALGSTQKKVVDTFINTMSST